MDLPLLWQIKKLPVTATLTAAVIVAVTFLPAAVCFRRIPDDLRIRTDQQIITPAFQLFAFGSVQHFVVFPVVSNPHTVYILHKIVLKSHRYKKYSIGRIKLRCWIYNLRYHRYIYINRKGNINIYKNSSGTPYNHGKPQKFQINASK